MQLPDLEELIFRAVRRIGFDLRRYRPDRSESARLSRMLTTHDIDLVFDVGANTGQYARSLRTAGYKGRIVSFEPLADAHGVLLANSRTDKKWEVAPPIAIGDCDSMVEFNVAANSVSSSILPMMAAHEAAAAESVFKQRIVVRQMRLDSVANDYVREGSTCFLKIDTQGYEDRVIDGATSLIARAAGLQVELSLVPLYAGQVLFDKMIKRISADGFELWSLSPGFTNNDTGRLLQFDAIFFRPSKAP
jgi:FkbM family methyltransferase